MTRREILAELGYDDTIVFENPSYESALIGVTDDGRAVYEYHLMIEDLMKTEGWTFEESMDWVEVNALRGLPYFGGKAPIVMYKLDEFML